MSQTLHMALWGFMLTFVVALTHYYLWARLVRDPVLPQPWWALATALLVILALVTPLSMVLGRFVGGPWTAPLVWVSFLWMGVAFFVLLGVGSADLLRLGSKIWASSGEVAQDPARRLFFSRVVGGGAAAAATLLGAVSVRAALAGARVARVEVTLGRLPASMDGITLVQISDLHVGPTIGRFDVKALVRKVNGLNPDLVVITGDLVDGSVAELAAAVAPLAELTSRWGTFFVTGNHEYYSGVAPWIAHLPSLGIRVLRNERVFIADPADPDAGFYLAGVNDPTGRLLSGDGGSDVAAACRDCEDEREIILLAHQPKAIHAAAAAKVGLVLAGHTHGGQIWPFGYLVRLTQPYMAGLYRHDPHTQIYVNRGTGYWGPPMRLGSTSEITQMTVRSARV